MTFTRQAQQKTIVFNLQGQAIRHFTRFQITYELLRTCEISRKKQKKTIAPAKCELRESHQHTPYEPLEFRIQMEIELASRQTQWPE